MAKRGGFHCAEAFAHRTVGYKPFDPMVLRGRSHGEGMGWLVGVTLIGLVALALTVADAWPRGAEGATTAAPGSVRYAAVVGGLDVVLVCGLVGGLVVGLIQGLLRQALTLASLYVGAVLAAQYYLVLGQALQSLVGGSQGTSAAIAAAGIFLVAAAALVGLGHLVFRQTALPSPMWLDRTTGAVLGLACGWVTVGIALTLLGFGASVPWGTWEWARVAAGEAVDRSALAPIVSATLPSIFDTMRPWLPMGLPALFGSLPAMLR